MTALDRPKIEVALLCDEVRREITGKDIIIGVYGDEVLVAAFPAQVFVTLYIRARFTQFKNEYPLEFRALGDRGIPLVAPAKTVLATQPSARLASLVISGIPIFIHSPGPIEFQWRPIDGEWEKILSIDVKQGAGPKGGPLFTPMIPSA